VPQAYNQAMPLNMPEGYSRYKRHLARPLPGEAVQALRELINIIAGQGGAKQIYEHFKRHFAPAAGREYVGSSDEGWASTDLSSDMEAAAADAPVFLSAFYDAIESLRSSERYDLPTVEDVNDRLRVTRAGFELEPPNIVTHSVAVTRAIQNAMSAASGAFAALKALEEQSAGEEEAQDRPFPELFDVAITVAGPDRKLARELAERLQTAGMEVFYDEFFPEHLWGRNLSDMFDEIFRVRARFCAMFISKAYATREWTNHERQSALARAMKERGKAYVLPIRVDETELTGLPPNIGYVSIHEKSMDEIAALLVKKVRGARRSGGLE
jgi:hypothetical protein